MRDMKTPAGSRVMVCKSASIRFFAMSFCKSVDTRKASALTITVCANNASPLTKAKTIITGGATQIISAARPSASALKIYFVSSG